MLRLDYEGEIMSDLQPPSPQVSRVRVTRDLKSDLARAVEAIRGWKWLSGDETVLG
jgi:hypothetical protein